MSSRNVDVAVIGGGPAGYGAALAAAGAGASVVLAEPERLGGTCVHWSCIPTNILLAASRTSIEARELTLLGVLDGGDSLDLGRLGARRDALTRLLAGGVAAALRGAGAEVLGGRATLEGRGRLQVEMPDGSSVDVSATSIVIAAGARWQLPELPGISSSRVLTADLVQALDVVPASALVLGGGPADTAFAVEYAFWLASLGSAVTFLVPGPLIVPALDADLDPAVEGLLGTFGVEVLRSGRVLGADPTKATVAHARGEAVVGAEVVVIADRRVPTIDGIGIGAAGVATHDGAVRVDGSGRTSVPDVLAAGDVAGGRMLTAAALRTGRAAGITAAGGDAFADLRVVPHVLHTIPGIGWVGASESGARSSGADVAVAVVDLAANARAVATGGRDGYLKLIADAGTGELLGVHVVGPDVAEVLGMAGLAMQAELTVEDLAATVAWHPSVAESLIDAARQLA